MKQNKNEYKIRQKGTQSVHAHKQTKYCKYIGCLLEILQITNV